MLLLLWTGSQWPISIFIFNTAVSSHCLFSAARDRKAATHLKDVFKSSSPEGIYTILSSYSEIIGNNVCRTNGSAVWIFFFFPTVLHFTKMWRWFLLGAGRRLFVCVSMMGKALSKVFFESLHCHWLTRDFDFAGSEFIPFKAVMGGCRHGRGQTGFKSHSKEFLAPPIISPDLFLSSWLVAATTMDSKRYLPNEAPAPMPLEARLEDYLIVPPVWWAVILGNCGSTLAWLGMLWVPDVASVYTHSPSSGIWGRREVTAEAIHFNKPRIQTMAGNPGFKPQLL